MGDFWNWLTSGWDEAGSQWAHPLDALSDSVRSTLGLPIIPIPGSTEFGASTGYGIEYGTTDGAGTDGTDTGSDNYWPAAIFALIAVVVVLLLVREVRSI